LFVIIQRANPVEKKVSEMNQGKPADYSSPIPKDIFRQHIALPQDHGSWVFVLSPLAIGLVAGRRFTPATLLLVVGVMAAFLVRQPVTMLVKVFSGRRSRRDLPPALLWAAVYSLIGLGALGGLVAFGYPYLLLLALPGIPVFIWHLVLVSRRAERRQLGIELVASGVLALAAPAALWVGVGRSDPDGWWLWILTWGQSAASIVYAYLRLEQRDNKTPPSPPELWRMARPAFLFATFNVSVVILLILAKMLPPLLFLPYLLQWGETIWGTFHPAVGWKPSRIGTRQLIVSVLFTVLFIFVWSV
jgi:hypothetical protein